MKLKTDDYEIEGTPEEIKDFMVMWSQVKVLEQFHKLADEILEAEG